MTALQNRRVKQPDYKSGADLHAWQWMAGKKTTHNSQRVKRKPPPKQPGDGSEQISQRRQMIKNRMQVMCFELAFLHQIHHACDASQRKRANQREPTSRPDQHVDRSYRPRKKDKNLKKVRERTAPQLVPAHRQERR